MILSIFGCDSAAPCSCVVFPAVNMRVVHLLRKLDPEEWGGTETAIQRLLEGLRQHRITSVVYCPNVKSNRRGGGLQDPLIRAGHSVRRFKSFLPVLGISRQYRDQCVAVGGNLMSFDLPWKLWHEKDVSVVHAHTSGRLGGIGLALARRRRIPFVITIHGGVLDLPEQLKASFSNRPEQGWDWGRVFGFVLRSRHLFEEADAILTCNPREAELWRERYPHKRIVVQPHGVPLAQYQSDHRDAALAAFPQLRINSRGTSKRSAVRGQRSEMRDQSLVTSAATGKIELLSPADNRELSQILLCVGRIDPVKNQGWLLDQARSIFQRHSQALLVFAGPCTDEAYGEAIREKVRALGLENRVVMTGGLPPDDPRLIGLFQLATAVILPSVSETFGLVLLEAWAAGAPVLSSRTSGPSALIQDGQNGWLFDLDRPETFHSALDGILGNPAGAEQAAARGATEAAQYSVEAAAGRMKRLYEELIESKHSECRMSRVE
ncbi:MAG: hypothetical protein C5B50_12585 [Verrucomicrobia bacterium]|nr:MAG: hypothetical protein C5B50_12585 [Verrucomicrobiota bacterium]